MIGAWMVYALGVSALMACAATVMHTLRKGGDHAVRGIWAGAMACTIALTLSAPFRVQRMTPILSAAPTNVTSVERTIPRRTFTDRARDVAGELGGIVAKPFNRALLVASRLSPAMHRLVAAVWLLSTLAACVVFGGVYWRTIRLRRHWATRAILGVPVRVADNIGPAVIGVSPAEIVVPIWLLTRSATEQQLVLDHELSHVRARDPLLLLAACVAVTAMPWNPALWFMLSRLRLAVELDCDRRLLNAGIPTRSYGHLLIELSQHPSSVTSLSPAFSHTVSHLERRLLAMTARRTRPSLFARITPAVVGALTLLAACESKLPTAAEVDGMTASTATKRAAEVAGMITDTARTTYEVDGRIATKQEAEAIASAKIASIEVVRAKSATGTSKVAISTVKGSVVNDSLREMSFTAIRASDSLSGKGTARVIEMKPATANGSTIIATRDKTPFNGLLVVDGVITEESKLNTLPPEKIESVQVLKGASATTLYSDPRAANGVIVIKMKKKD